MSFRVAEDGERFASTVVGSINFRVTKTQRLSLVSGISITSPVDYSRASQNENQDASYRFFTCIF